MTSDPSEPTTWCGPWAASGRGPRSSPPRSRTDLADNWLGLRRLELSVYTDNAPAIRLYEKFDILVEGTARQFALRGGRYVDAHYMA